MSYIGKTTDGFGVRDRFVYVVSAGATSVSGADANGATLKFTDGAYVDVYLNGVLLKPTTDYNTSTANTIAGISSMSASDEVTVIVYDVFTVADAVSATSGGTFVGGVTFNGNIDVDGTANLDVVDIDGALTQDGGAVFNEASADVDFRVESDNDANAFFVQGSDGKIGMGISTPRNNLDFGVTSNNDHVIALRDNNTSRTILGLSNGYGVRVAAPHDGTNSENIFEVGEIAGDGTTYQNTKFNVNYNGQWTHTTDINSLAGTIKNTNSSPYGIYIQFTGAAPNNVDNYFLSGLDSSATRIKLYSSGTIKNSTGTYTSFSDERLKSDIVDAKSQWEDIKALNFKNFIKFDNPDFKQLGLIAQDVEKTSPNLVFETPPEPEEIKHSSVFGTLYKDGDELPENKKVGDVKEVKSQVKNVKDSILYMKAVKALQEAMTRIETLEAKVKALEEA